DARVYRSPRPRIAQSFCRRNGRCRGFGVSAAGEFSRPAVAGAERGGACGIDAVLGGSGRSAFARAVGEPVDRKTRGRGSVDTGQTTAEPAALARSRSSYQLCRATNPYAVLLRPGPLSK